MLTRLSVSNFAIIDRLNLEFKKGLTIITGETGTGKSIMLGALKLIMGERADLKQLNQPNQKCVIEACFDISNLNLTSFFEENELDYEPETILRRELLPNGKSRAFINDTPVNLNLLEKLNENLIDIHSQFNTANLFDQNYQLQILDAYAGQLNRTKDYKNLLDQRNQRLSALKKATEELNELNKEAGYHQFLLDELLTADLKDGEFEELEKEQNELSHIEEIRQILSESENRLDQSEVSILSQLNLITALLHKAAGFGEALSEFYARIDSVRIELIDLTNGISSKLRQIEANPERLIEVSQRLDLINNLLNKHRCNTIGELKELMKSLVGKKSNSENLESQIEYIKKEIVQLEKQLEEFAIEISESRRKVIPKVEKELVEHISKLGMENASVKLDQKIKSSFGANGKDEIGFLFSANKGSSLKPVEKSVSGGELSRLMLAVKKIISGKIELPTLILDEIDTGVSGKVADEVGNMMKEMSKNIQLITITHLPQVAAKGIVHLKVSKNTNGQTTTTQVTELDLQQRIVEVAGLISGSKISDTALKQAEILINA